MIKRGLCILILGIFLVSVVASISSVYALPALNSFEDKMVGVDKTKEQVEEEGLEYLSGKFQNLMLKNKVVEAVDGFFLDYPLVWRILFGIPYSLSFGFILVIILWIYFSFQFGRLIGATGFLTGPLQFLGGAIVSIVLAQAGFFRYLSLFLLNIVFGREYVWMRFLIGAIIIILFVLFRMLDKKLAIFIDKKFNGSENLLKNKLKAEREREKERKSHLGLVPKK
jgi:hypothetical protein